MGAEELPSWQNLNHLKKRAADLQLHFSQAAQKMQSGGTPLSQNLVE
ncbi:hypothetical protein [Microcoleus sp. bin38.metabat.b11b12b14.051]|nr:hypothetical protein [Microcoleus sp. bin38.metabat.b11b12b14.051]